MAKNKRFIEEQKWLHRQAATITPAVYASIAIPLFEKYGWDGDKIADLFMASQEEWDNNFKNGGGMIKRCEEITGIQLVRWVEGESKNEG